MFGSLNVQNRVDQVAEVRGDTLGEAGEQIRRRRLDPASHRAATQRGVVKWWRVTTGVESVLKAARAPCAGSGRAAACENSPSSGSMRLHSTREPVGVEAQLGEQREVLRVAVLVVAGVTTRLDAG